MRKLSMLLFLCSIPAFAADSQWIISCPTERMSQVPFYTAGFPKVSTKETLKCGHGLFPRRASALWGTPYACYD
jgi:hypothetical protein